jgi:hypothetical protein
VTAKLTGWGLWAIAAAGVLTLVPWIVIFFVPNPDVNTDQAGFARAVTDALHAIVGYLYIIGLLCLLFGVLAISAWLQDTQVRSDPVTPARAASILRRAWNASGSSYAAVGMVFGVVATTLVIGTWTILVVATPTVGDVYLSGHPGAGEVFKVLSGGHWGARVVPLFIVTGLADLAAAYSLGDAIRRSGRVPKWAGPVFGVGFALTIVSAPLVSLIGAVLLIVAGIMMARGATQTVGRAAA